MHVMEQNAMIQPEWTKVTEAELVYKIKLKASERHKPANNSLLTQYLQLCKNLISPAQ
jgi:hypothetical protein